MKKTIKKVSVILPTYNEKDNIVLIIKAISKELKKLKEYSHEFVVVDDNSPDGTADAVRKNFKKTKLWKNINLIVRKERGLATALRRGIEEAKGDVIILMDVDFNHQPEDIPKLLKQLDKYDVAIGSRFVKGGGMEGAQIRWLGSFVLNTFIRIILGLKTRENLSGFIAIKGSILKKLDLVEIFQGYGDYNIILFKRLAELNVDVKEIPVVYKKRMHGEIKTNFVKHLIQYIMLTLKVRFARRKK